MRRSSLIASGIACILTLGLVLLAVQAQESESSQPEQENEKSRYESAIPFGKGGETALKLDLAMPKEGEGPFPVIICLHGGGWVGGERQQMKGTIEVLARRGYVAISPDYRPAPQDRFPAQIEDCKAAVRWVRAHAKEYRINPDKIGVFGFSAGGHLACLLGVTGKDDGLEGKGGNAEQSSAVQAVVSFFGPTDFTKPVWSDKVIERHLKPFLGGTAEEKAEAYRRASPLNYAGKNAPPFLFVHGTADDIVPIQQSEELVKKLRQAGVSARLIEVVGEGHGWGWSHDHRLTSLADMMNFFDETLRK